MNVKETLRISVSFPSGIYSGSDLGVPEDFPAPARIHEAFVAAAAGGPEAEPDGRVLVASERHRRALNWLEQHRPEGIVVPPAVLNRRRAKRYRWRVTPKSPEETSFEPSAALAGPVEYFWPAAPTDIADGLCEIAREVTHIGRADSVAIVSAEPAGSPPAGSGVLRVHSGRGPGRVLRLPQAGRYDVLAEAHRENSAPGKHLKATGKQDKDIQVTGANEAATELARFSPEEVAADAWPFDEIWELRGRFRETKGGLPAPATRVSLAVATHRAIVRAIGEDVPSFVTGREGDGPLRGAGHLAIHIGEALGSDGFLIWLAVPTDVGDGDRSALREAITRPIHAGLRSGWRKLTFSAGKPRMQSALPFWITATSLYRSASPMVLDAPGTPRRGRWSFSDAVICSVGYAFRGVLERRGFEWGRGWGFRQELVRTLRETYGVEATAQRHHGDASRYLHKANPGDLLVAAHAEVDLGSLAPLPGGFVALGRGRHLGGGLLVPASEGGHDGPR